MPRLLPPVIEPSIEIVAQNSEVNSIESNSEDSIDENEGQPTDVRLPDDLEFDRREKRVHVTGIKQEATGSGNDLQSYSNSEDEKTGLSETDEDRSSSDHDLDLVDGDRGYDRIGWKINSKNLVFTKYSRRFSHII